MIDTVDQELDQVHARFFLRWEATILNGYEYIGYEVILCFE